MDGSKFTASDRQKEIYVKGFSGLQSPIPVSWFSLEEKARAKMSPKAYAYIAGGAGLESTIDSNRSSFEKYKIVPRMLRDVHSKNIEIELFGRKIPAPILLSPVGVLEMVNKDADLAVGEAAAEIGIPYIFSNQASKPMEIVAAGMSESPRWFQLYWSRSNDLVASFVTRAERCGCSAIVVTLDTTMLGWRTRDLDLAYLPFLEGKGIAQYTSDPVFQKLMDEPEPQTSNPVTMQSFFGLMEMVKAYPGSGFIRKLLSGRPVKAVRKFISMYSNPALTWNALAFLREKTKLPIILKGILHPEDARLALENGMDGIIVSNHGGRQVDGAIGTVDALPGIVNEIRGRIPVLIDGGIRGGADIFKALALGATAVCIGRPYVYGLAISGKNGVSEVLKNLMADFELTMGLAGCKQVSEIKRDTLS